MERCINYEEGESFNDRRLREREFYIQYETTQNGMEFVHIPAKDLLEAYTTVSSRPDFKRVINHG